MLNVTWRRFDLSAKQLIVGHTTVSHVIYVRAVKLYIDEKLSYRRVTARCVLSVVILPMGRLKTQVRKTKVPEDGICKYGIRNYEYARVEMQVLKTQVRICNGGKRKYSNLKSILKSLRFSSLAFSVDPLSVGLDQFTCTVPDRCYTQEIGFMRRRAWVQKSQAGRCRVTVLGNCSHPLYLCLSSREIGSSPLKGCEGITAGLAESNGSLPPGLWLTSPTGWLPRTGISSGTLGSAIEYWLPLLFYFWLFTLSQKKKQSVIHFPTPFENAPH